MATDIIALQNLVENLAAKDAASVEANRDFLRDEPPRIELRISIVPADGAPVIAPYNTVTIEGHKYNLSYTLTLDGLTPGLWLPLYLSDSVVGVDPITVEEGMQDIKTKLSQVMAEE